MYNNVRIPRSFKCVALIWVLLLIVNSKTFKSNLNLGFCKLFNYQMNTIGYNVFKNIINKKYNKYKLISNIVDSTTTPIFASAYRINKFQPIRYSFFSDYRPYSTREYLKFLKMSEKELQNMDSTILLDLDVYRNDLDKSGKARLKVTEAEKRLFDVLTECVKFYDLNMDLRVVGGWVRDKLLEKENKDIDIAIPKMTGLEFCEYLNKFTNDKFGFSRTVGIVKRCPEQSKHLETATMNILGFDVDFVNLRSEDYTTESRIPVMRIGTPYEDAMRRDFTINSLFYNITKNCIEDFTQTGIEDLKNRLIKTCSSPFETFMDDPLRAVRAVRFSSRLDFKLDDELVKSLNDKVLTSLELKVSRPRISQELDNILLKSDVSKAFNQMYEFRILHVLLNIPTKGDEQRDPVSGVSTEMLSQSCVLMENLRKYKFPELDYKYLYLAALVAPTRELPMVNKMAVADYMIKERFKLPNKYSSSADIVSKGSYQFTQFFNNQKLDRVTLGMLIRNIGPFWKESLVLSLAENNRDPKAYQDLVNLTDQLGISETYKLKAPITGDDLRELLPKITSGPKFKEALEFQIKEKLENDKVTNDELKNKLKEQFKKYL